jgi:general secretion pathway protein F
MQLRRLTAKITLAVVFWGKSHCSCPAEQNHVSILAPLVPSAITLEDFVALNDELAALARAGVPLDKGLLELGSDVPGRVGRIAAEVGRRIEQGESLEQVVASSPDLFPPAYRAVIEAGMKVGRLPAALERVSETARRTAQLRQSFGLALFYPTAVLALAYGLFLYWLWHVAPVLASIFDDFGPAVGPVWDVVLSVRQGMWWWGPLVPLVVATWWCWFWWHAGRAATGLDPHPLLAVGTVGRLAAMRRAGRLAAVTDTLAILVEYGVPLEKGIVLAAQASGDSSLIAAGGVLAERWLRGGPAGIAPPFPPMLLWVLSSSQLQAELPRMLRRMAGLYREEAARHGQWLSVTRPLVLTILLGGGTVFLFAMVHLGPFLLLLYQLGRIAFLP